MGNKRANLSVPAGWSQQDRRFGESIKQNLDILQGQRGDKLDRAVTFRDLLDTGLVTLARGVTNFDGNASSVTIGTGLANLDIPPAPTNLTANGAFQNIILRWDLKLYAGHSHVQVWRHTSDEIASAKEIAQISGFTGVYADPVGSGSVFYYWVRAINENDIPGPFNSSSGTVGQTAVDADYMLTLLTDQITSSQLASTLEDRIDLIDAAATVQNSVAWQVAQEATARAAAITAEATARGTAITNEASARATAIAAEASARAAAISAIVSDIPIYDSTAAYAVDQVVRISNSNSKLYICIQAVSENSSVAITDTGYWKLYGDYDSIKSSTDTSAAAITEINTISATSSSAAATAIKALQSTVNDPTTGVSATAGALNTLSTAVNHTDTGLSATASDLTSLETALFEDLLSLDPWSSGANYAEGARVSHNQKAYRAIQASTSSSPKTPGVHTSYWALDTIGYSSAISQLSSRVTNDYATASSLTNLESATFSNLTGLSAYNSANSYSAGDRVTHGTGANKAIYTAVAASSSSNPQAPGNTSYWSQDSLASNAAMTAALAGKETSGAAASALTSANTYTDTNSASATEFSALETALYEDVVGVNAWTNSTSYAVGDRVYHDQKVWKASQANSGQTPANNSSYWTKDSVASSSALSTLNTEVFGTGASSSRIDTLESEVFDANGDGKLALASAFNTLESAVNHTDTGLAATATDLSSLETALFTDLLDLDAWSSSASYSVGARVSYNKKAYRAIQASSSSDPQTPGVHVNWSSTVNYSEGDRVVHTDSNNTTNIYRALLGNSNSDPSQNLTGSNPKWTLDPTAISTNFWSLDSIAYASAVSGLQSTLTEDYVEATDFSLLSTDVYQGAFGGKKWDSSTSFAQGDTVIHQGVAYIALANNTNSQPPNSNWQLSPLINSQTMTSYVAGQTGGLATSSALTQVRNDAYNNLTGVPDWSSSTSYAEGARVVHTDSNNTTKIYRALLSNSNADPSQNLTGSNPKWILDPTASSIALSNLSSKLTNDYTNTTSMNALLANKEDAGTASGLITTSEATAAETYATSTTVSAQYAAIFEKMTGANDWISTTSYAVDDRVIYETGTPPVKNLYRAKLASTGKNPLTQTAYWELDTVAYAGAVDSLYTDVNGSGGIVERVSGVELRLDDVNGDSTDISMEQKFSAQANDIGDLEAQYTVKVDANGYVSGFGLANTVNNATPSSEFFVNADRFAILPDRETSVDPAWASGVSYANGARVSYGGNLYLARFAHTSSSSSIPSPTSGYWVKGDLVPFVVQATGTYFTNPDNSQTYIPPGVYMNSAVIKHAAITAAQIGTVNADTINSGFVGADRIEGGSIVTSKLSIDNNHLTQDSNGELLLVTSNGSNGIKVENLSNDAVGTVFFAESGGYVSTSNQSLYMDPEDFVASTPWYQAPTPIVVMGSVVGYAGTTSLPQILSADMSGTKIKESGDYTFDFGASIIGGASSFSASTDGQLMMEVFEAPSGSSSYTNHTSAVSILKSIGNTPLSSFFTTVTINLTAGKNYRIRLYGYNRGISANTSSQLGWARRFVRVFRINKST